MTKLKVTYYCYDGGYGWGETGDRVAIVFPKDSTNKLIESYHPGGWKIETKELTEEYK